VSLVRQLLSKSAIIFSARIVGAALMFITQAIIARKLGSLALGQYTQATATMNILASVMPLGFQVIASYFAVEYATRGQSGVLWTFLKQTYLQTIVVAGALFLAGLAFIPKLQPVQLLWVPICIMAISIAFVFISGSVLVALKRPIIGLSADIILRPLTIAAALALALFVSPKTDTIKFMLWAMAFVFMIISLIHAAIAVTAIQNLNGESTEPQNEQKRWWRFALPWVLITLATDYFFDLDVILLSSMMSYSDLAVFGAITRVFSIAAFGVSTIYAISLPDIFEAEVNDGAHGFQKKIAKTNLLACCISIVMLLGVLVSGPTILSIFGPEFVKGAGPLAILCLSLLVRSVFGPAALALSMHNKPHLSLPSVVLGLACLVAANMLLVPIWGLYGASLAALFAIIIWSLSMWFAALNHTMLDVSIFSSFSNVTKNRTKPT
jgi:O-antigen/teichoic acid export membrane protein